MNNRLSWLSLTLASALQLACIESPKVAITPPPPPPLSITPFESEEELRAAAEAILEPIIKRLLDMEKNRDAVVKKRRAELAAQSQLLKLDLEELELYKKRAKIHETRAAPDQRLFERIRLQTLQVSRSAEELEKLTNLDDEGLFHHELASALEKDGNDVALFLTRFAGLVAKRHGSVGEWLSSQALILAAKFQLHAESRSAKFEDLHTLFEDADEITSSYAALASAIVFSGTFKTPGKSTMVELDADEIEGLDSLVKSISYLSNSGSHIRVHIDGHADSLLYPGSRCRSDNENLRLSLDRAINARNHLEAGLRQASGLVEFSTDGFGNQAPLSGAPLEGEENRRIEVRMDVVNAEEKFHSKYHEFRSGFDYQGRFFVRQDGLWIEQGCVGRVISRKLNYGSVGFSRSFWSFPLEFPERVMVPLNQGNDIMAWPGHHFVGLIGNECVEVDCVP